MSPRTIVQKFAFTANPHFFGVYNNWLLSSTHCCLRLLCNQPPVIEFLSDVKRIFQLITASRLIHLRLEITGSLSERITRRILSLVQLPRFASWATSFSVNGILQIVLFGLRDTSLCVRKDIHPWMKAARLFDHVAHNECLCSGTVYPMICIGWRVDQRIAILREVKVLRLGI